MIRTEKLGIEIDRDNSWIGGCWEVDNLSKGYHGLIETWWKKFGLKGNGLIVGESGNSAEAIKEKLKRERKEINNIWSVDLADADINCDITYPISRDREPVDWIICCATIEHISCPGMAMKNLTDILIPGGKLYVHVAGINFPLHRFPIDCCRLYPDAFIDWAKRFNLRIVDALYTPTNMFVLYEKENQWEIATKDI